MRCVASAVHAVTFESVHTMLNCVRRMDLDFQTTDPGQPLFSILQYIGLGALNIHLDIVDLRNIHHINQPTHRISLCSPTSFGAFGDRKTPTFRSRIGYLTSKRPDCSMYHSTSRLKWFDVSLAQKVILFVELYPQDPCFREDHRHMGDRETDIAA